MLRGSAKPASREGALLPASGQRRPASSRSIVAAERRNAAALLHWDTCYAASRMLRDAAYASVRSCLLRDAVPAGGAVAGHLLPHVSPTFRRCKRFSGFGMLSAIINSDPLPSCCPRASPSCVRVLLGGTCISALRPRRLCWTLTHAAAAAAGFVGWAGLVAPAEALREVFEIFVEEGGGTSSTDRQQ